MAGRKRTRLQHSSNSIPPLEKDDDRAPRTAARSSISSSPSSSAAVSPAAGALFALASLSSSSSSSPRAAAAADSESKAEVKAESKAEAEMAPSSSSPQPPHPNFLSSAHGYVKAAFVDAVDADWLCPVCAAVCRDAETSVCCQRLACRRCVTNWFLVNTSSTCPLCRRSPCNRGDFLPAPYIDRRVRSLTIRCPLGCDATELVIGLKEQTLQEHLNDACLLRRKICPYRCRASYAVQDAAQHLQVDCLNRPVRCRHGCEQLVNPSDAYVHDRHCRMNCVPCPLVCFESMAQQEADELPNSARRYYADSSSSVSTAAAYASSCLFDAQDVSKRWLVARALHTKDARVLVHYEYWSSRWDDWLPVDSARIAPLNTHTVPTTPPYVYNFPKKTASSRSLSPLTAPHPLPFLCSSAFSSSSAVLSRSLIQVAAVNDHLATVCPNRLKLPDSGLPLSLSDDADFF